MKDKNQSIDRAESSILWILAIAIIVKVLLFTTSCKTLEQKCTERFPSEVTEVVVEVTTTDSLYITEKLLEFIDTTECLPTRDAYFVYDTIVYRLPGETVYYEYTCIDTIIEYRDQEKVNYLTAELRAEQSKQEVLKAQVKSGKRWIWGFVGMSVLAVLFFVLMLLGVAKDK